MTDSLHLGAPVPAPGFHDARAFGSVEREYAALRAGVALIDRSARLRMTFTGAKAGEALTGLVTSDVLALKSGDGQFAAALTAKGKVIADVRIFARDDHYLVDTSPAAAPGFATMIRKYVNPRLAKYADVSDAVRTIGVFGPPAAAALATAFGVPEHLLNALAPYSTLAHEWHGAHLLFAAAPDLGLPGWDLFVPESNAAAAWSAMLGADAIPVGTDAAEIARIEAGFPRWGADMDDTTLAQEANFDELGGISYTKGCYTGQETVARVHFRGHVNRTLRGLRGDVQLPKGAQVFDASGESCGDVRSSALSPRLGAVAIAMLRRSVASGATVEARWDALSTAAVIHDLPFA